MNKETVVEISFADACTLLDLGDILIEFPDFAHADLRCQLRNLGKEDREQDRLIRLAKDLKFLIWNGEKELMSFGEGVVDILEDGAIHYRDCIDQLGWQHEFTANE